VTLAAAVLGATATANAASRALYRPQALGSPLAVGFAPGSVPDPHGNLPPSPNYLQACAEQGWSNKSCVVQALSAIEHARKHEGVKKPRLVLPNNYDALSTAEQTFVITDLERTARGLKPFRGLTATLNTASRLAAVLRLDPTPAISLLRLLGVTEYGAIWAGDFGPLASDYDWMYNDGYSASGSINIVCLIPRSSGCWGHRENILGGYHSAPTLLAGAGTGQPAGASIAEVLTGGYGRAPKFTYTWKQAVRHGAANARASS
jgi:hypothetical protein